MKVMFLIKGVYSITWVNISKHIRQDCYLSFSDWCNALLECMKSCALLQDRIGKVQVSWFFLMADSWLFLAALEFGY